MLMSMVERMFISDGLSYNCYVDKHSKHLSTSFNVSCFELKVLHQAQGLFIQQPSYIL